MRLRGPFRGLAVLAIVALHPLLSGCGNLAEIIDELDLDDIEIEINEAVGVIQTEDPRTVVLPAEAIAAGDTVIINNDVTIINNIQGQIVIEQLPNVVLIGFQNLTGTDTFLEYFADGVYQGIFVFDGETLLLEYPCLSEIELVAETDFDPFSGILIEEFQFEGAVFFNPEDFGCGDAFILTIDPDAITAEATLIDLL